MKTSANITTGMPASARRTLYFSLFFITLLLPAIGFAQQPAGSIQELRLSNNACFDLSFQTTNSTCSGTNDGSATVTAIETPDFVVNAIADNADASPGDGTCADANGNCTFRAAVQEANLRERSVISFNNSLNSSTIVLNSQIQLSGNMIIRGPGQNNLTISGGNTTRIFFVTNGRIGIDGLRLTAGKAQGGNAGAPGGGGGLGVGGAILVHEGTSGVVELKISNLKIDNCSATGGQGAVANAEPKLGGGGGGGINSSGSNGGSGSNGRGGNGGNGGGPNGGGGGSGTIFIGDGDLQAVDGGGGGFGGGGGGGGGGLIAEFDNPGANGGSGGFGGGGGGGGNAEDPSSSDEKGGNGGNGGFGAGGGKGGVGETNGTNGNGGFGGTNATVSGGGNGAGFGGAVFVVSGDLTVASTVFMNNSATGATGAQGKGAAIGVYNHATYGSVDGKSNAKTTLASCNGGNTFSGNNSATNANANATATDGVTVNDNEDVFGKVFLTNNATCAFNSFSAFTFPSLQFTVNVTGDNGDNNPGDGVCNDGTNNCSLRAAIQEANTVNSGKTTINFSGNLSGQTITVGSQIEIKNNIAIVGLGKALLTISGNNNTRIFYVSAGRVNIDGLKLLNGRAIGGNGGVSGGGGGLGAGGAILVHESTITPVMLNISNVHFDNNSAIGGNGGGINNTVKFGGGGGGGINGNGASGGDGNAVRGGNGGNGGGPNDGGGGSGTIFIGDGDIPAVDGGGGGFGGGGGGGGGGLIAEFDNPGANGGGGGFGGGGGGGGNTDDYSFSEANGGNGGNGGFGAGGGKGGVGQTNGSNGNGGYGATNATAGGGGNGAGFGGALYAASGTTTLANCMFTNNRATAPTGALAKGGAVSVYDYATYGAVNGKANAKLVLSTCGDGNSFSGSIAANNANNNALVTNGVALNDNKDVFGKAFSTNAATCMFTTLNDVEYLWSNGATTATNSGIASGNYNVTVTDNIRNCTATGSINVQANTNGPIISAGPNSQTVCSGANVAFSASVAEGIPNPANDLFLQWQVSTNGGSSYSNINGETTASLSLSNVSVGLNGNRYRLVVTENGACTTESSVALLAVNQSPTVYNVTGGGAYCQGGSGVSVGLNDSETGVSYQLKRNNSNAGSPINGDGNAIPFGNQTVAGTYTILATNSNNGCTKSMSGEGVVSVNPNPTASVTATASPVCLSAGVGFTISGTADAEVSYNINGGATQMTTLTGGMQFIQPSVNAAGNVVLNLLSVTKAGCTTSLVGINATVVVRLCITGFIEWENKNVGVKDVIINAAGPSNGSDQSDTNGDYDITVNTAGAYTLTPSKNLNKFNGVTAADATRIQQHVTGANPLGAPYPRISADVNKNNVISVQDASLITQAILGNQSANNLWNTSWRFVKADYIFPNPNAPWGFPETIVLNNVTNDATNQDFRGIKLGDVTTPAANPQNRPEAIVLRTADLPLTAGETVLVPVQVNGFTDIAAFQFVLRFDPQVLHFDQVEVPAGGIMSTSNFGSFLSEFGELRAAYAAADAESVTDGSDFFTLRFTALQSGATLASTIRLDETDFPAEAYTVNIEPRPIQLSFSPITAVSGVHSQDISLSAIPNPASVRTNLHVNLPQASMAIIRVTDIQGRILLDHKSLYPAGLTVFPLEIAHPGVYFAELHTPQGTQVVKVVIGL